MADEGGSRGVGAIGICLPVPQNITTANVNQLVLAGEGLVEVQLSDVALVSCPFWRSRLLLGASGGEDLPTRTCFGKVLLTRVVRAHMPSGVLLRRCLSGSGQDDFFR